MKATCDQCSEVFKVKYKETKHPKGVIETYFTCSHCSHKYLCFVTDTAVRKQQKEMIRMRADLGKLKGEKFWVMQAAIIGKQEAVNTRMEELKKQLASG